MALSRMLPGSRAAGSPATLAWGVSLFAHLCAGVACFFMAGSAFAPAEPAGGQTPAEVPVAVVWAPRPEVERAASRCDPEQVPPEPLTVQPMPALDPPPVPLPPPTWEVVATLLPPEPPEESVALFVASPLPPIADMTPPAPEVAEPCVEEPAAAPSAPVAEAPAAAPTAIGAQETADEAPSAPAVVLAAAPSPDNVPPAYPRAARRRGHEGLVVVSARVSPSGDCVAAAILRSSGHRELDEAAEEAVRAWQFRPALRDGTPVEAELEIPIRFKLTD